MAGEGQGNVRGAWNGRGGIAGGAQGEAGGGPAGDEEVRFGVGVLRPCAGPDRISVVIVGGVEGLCVAPSTASGACVALSRLCGAPRRRVKPTCVWV